MAEGRHDSVRHEGGAFVVPMGVAQMVERQALAARAGDSGVFAREPGAIPLPAHGLPVVEVPVTRILEQFARIDVVHALLLEERRQAVEVRLVHLHLVVIGHVLAVKRVLVRRYHEREIDAPPERMGLDELHRVGDVVKRAVAQLVHAAVVVHGVAVIQPAVVAAHDVVVGRNAEHAGHLGGGGHPFVAEGEVVVEPRAEIGHHV